MKMTTLVRGSAAAVGAVLLASAGTAMAVADEVDGDGVTVNVAIEHTWEPGVLAMSVAQNSIDLAEDGSTQLERRFVGTLPEVTVTDTRASGEQWYVTGVISDFASDASTIGAEYFGWSPQLTDDPGDATVEVGGDVEGELDGGPGLTDGWDLLYATWDSQAAIDSRQGTWGANADLELKVPASVSAGDYSALLTLSLFG